MLPTFIPVTLACYKNEAPAQRSASGRRREWRTQVFATSKHQQGVYVAVHPWCVPPKESHASLSTNSLEKFSLAYELTFSVGSRPLHCLIRATIRFCSTRSERLRAGNFRLVTCRRSSAFLSGVRIYAHTVGDSKLRFAKRHSD